MKKIRRLKTTQIMIFQADDIDIVSIRRKSSIKKLQSLFSLNFMQLPENLPVQVQPQLIFQNGEFKLNDKIYDIEQLVIEDRKIIINIYAEYEISNAFFDDIKNLFISFESRDQPGDYNPIITTYETLCVSNLNIEFENFFKKDDTQKIESIISEKDSHGASIKLYPTSFKFKIKYDDIPDDLKGNNISINDKQLIVELRDMTNPKDKIFYTFSPTRSDVHLKLLDTLEKLF